MGKSVGWRTNLPIAVGCVFSNIPCVLDAVLPCHWLCVNSAVSGVLVLRSPGYLTDLDFPRLDLVLAAND
jgi:hypothetical protein